MKKKTVIITGGTKGIGAALTQAYVNAGYAVVIGARTDNGLAKKLSDQVTFVKCDVRREEDHIKLADTAKKWTGRLDVYINCAGFSQWKSISNVTENFWNDMIDTNLKGTFWGCKVAAKALSTNGCIVNISSLAAKRGSTNNSVYCASKFGVTGLTQALAKELGSKGIRVNAVCPVYIQSPGLMKALKDKSSPTQGKDVQQYLKTFSAQQSALGRMPTEEEVANLCLFLSSDAASGMTGQSINIDCGVMPQ